MQEYGGFTDAARMLNEEAPRADGYPHTRQQVYIWHSRRTANRFPDMYTREEKGRTRQRLKLREVLDWYRSYQASSGSGRKSTA